MSMSLNPKMKSTMIVVLTCIAMASVANATIDSTVKLVNHNNQFSDTATIYGGGLNGLTGYTGIYSWTVADSTGSGEYFNNWGFCIELTQSPTAGWYSLTDLESESSYLAATYSAEITTAKANAIRELWGRYFDSAWTTGANKQFAEAFGVALWEIIYETDSTWDVTTGSGFRTTGVQQAATANMWLNSLTGDTAYFAQNLAVANSLSGQDFLTQIPEPATLFLLAMGGLLTGWFQKRKKPFVAR